MNKTLIFKPSKLLLLPQLLISILLIALLALQSFRNLSHEMNTLGSFTLLAGGVVLLALRIGSNYRKLNREQYLISDTAIQIQTAKDDYTITLTNIRDISGKVYWWLPFSKLGRITIYANGRHRILRGIKDAKDTAAIIRMAVEAAISSKKKRPEPMRYQPPVHSAGTLERLNDLVGMWQQGLISDDVFESEKKKI